MSEFLLVTPADWTEIPNAQELADAAGGIVAAQDFINQAAWGFVDSMIEPSGLIPPLNTVGDARLFQTEQGLRLWVKFIPV